MIRALAAAILLVLAVPAGAACRGDFDGDNMVKINELIIAVGNALNGCPVGACPIDFSVDNSQTGSTDCFYLGRWNQTCGAADLEARFISDSHSVIVDFTGFTPGLFYAANVTSPTTADLVGWYQQPDASDGIKDAPGTLTLSDGGGSLVVAPNTSPFKIDGCDFVRYAGTLSQVVGGPAAARAGAHLPYAAAFERLRAAREAAAPRPNLERGAGAQNHVD